MTKKLCLRDLNLRGKKVLMRVDFNVPMDEQGDIVDDTRIRAALPSIEHVVNNGGSLILMSHLGRPKGEANMKWSLAPVAERLSSLMGKEVKFSKDSVGKEAHSMAFALKHGEIMLLENLRFSPGEEKPSEDPSFAQKLAQLGDVYVNDAFGTAHREHSSVTKLPEFFPQESASGFLMEKELECLGGALNDPKRPLFAVIGGAKVSSKLGIIKSLLNKVDALFIGGGMAFTFWKAKGLSIGKSLFEESFVSQAKELLSLCNEREIPIYLPHDVLAGDQFAEDAGTKLCAVPEGIPDGWMGMDLGPKTIEEWRKSLSEAATLLWNGPLGVAEFEAFAVGTREVAQAVADSKAFSIVGGGDSIAALKKLGLAGEIDHISTGGGAALEFIEKGTLPGLEALTIPSAIEA